MVSMPTLIYFDGLICYLTHFANENIDKDKSFVYNHIFVNWMYSNQIGEFCKPCCFLQR